MMRALLAPLLLAACTPVPATEPPRTVQLDQTDAFIIHQSNMDALAREMQFQSPIQPKGVKP